VARVSRILASRLARRQATMGGLLILIFGSGVPSLAQTGTQPTDTAVWARCQEAPTRRCVLRRALDVATTSKEVGRRAFLILFMIAAAQADAGLARDASATADLLKSLPGLDAHDPLSREVDTIVDRVKAIDARTQADAGKLEEAMSIASAISGPGVRGATIGSVAIAEGKAGSIDDALKRVQTVQDDTERAIAVRRAAWGLRFIATQRGEDGKIAEALRQSQSADVTLKVSATEDLIPQMLYGWSFAERSASWMWVPALQIIVEAQIEAGKVAEAMQAVRSADASYEVRSVRANVFAAVLRYLAGAGRLSEGLRLALELGDHLVVDNPFVLANLAQDTSDGSLGSWMVDSRNARRRHAHQPELRAGLQGKVDPEAVAVARSFPAEGRAAALHMVAEVLGRAGEPGRAAEAAQLIDEPRHRVGALIAVGLAQATAGFQASAQAAFGEAVQIAQSLGDDLPIPGSPIQNARRTVLAYIATEQARAGMAAEALQIVRLVEENGYYRADDRSVSDLVQALAEGGGIDEAIQAAGRLGQYREDLILGRAAAALSRAGHGAAALKVAGAIPANDARVAALAEIARELRRAGADGDAATAVRSAISIVDPASIGDLISLSRALPD
jgi:hypothetical protein